MDCSEIVATGIRDRRLKRWGYFRGSVSRQPLKGLMVRALCGIAKAMP